MNTNYITYLISEQKSSKTIEAYTQYVQKMLSYIHKKESDITFLDLSNWKASLSSLSSSSINLQIAAVKNYFNFLENADLIKKNPTIKLKTVNRKNKIKPYAEPWMIEKMLNATTNDRNKAIILLFSTTGIRVNELINITIDQYKNMDGNDNREITIVGKGNKERKIYINDKTKIAIDCYLISRPNTECDKLFLSFQGGMLHSNNLNQTLKNIAKKAEIPFWNDISNHWFRAAFATMQSQIGTPVATIQAALGHSSLATTSIYIKHYQQEINEATQKIYFNYKENKI